MKKNLWSDIISNLVTEKMYCLIKGFEASNMFLKKAVMGKQKPGKIA